LQSRPRFSNTTWPEFVVMYRAPDRRPVWCARVILAGGPVITSEECKRYTDSDPNSSIQRATAAMAVCRMLIRLGAEIAVYERIIAEERNAAN